MHSHGEPQTQSNTAGSYLLVTTSWDDGHPSDLRVMDLLGKHGIKGSFYVPCTNSEGKPVMHWTEIARLGRQFEVGGHTRDHISLTGIARHEAAEQIRANKHWLEDLLGREVCGFAYVRGRHNRIVRSLVAEAGFRYARTVKSLMSTPGPSRLQVPTTAQFFAHRDSTYIRNYISGGPTLQRSAILSAVLTNEGLTARLSSAAAACAGLGGYFHLWGHSWELEQYHLWDELDRFLGCLTQLPARFVTNAEWYANYAGCP